MHSFREVSGTFSVVAEDIIMVVTMGNQSGGLQFDYIG